MHETKETIFEKSKKIIDGCLTREQLQSAQSFVELYWVQTKDEEGYKSLQQKLLTKDRELFPLGILKRN